MCATIGFVARVGGHRAALVGPQRAALPLGRLAVRRASRARGIAIATFPNVPRQVCWFRAA
jgi:hypothetical protein